MAKYLCQLLSRLDALGLKVNSNKCNFGKPAVKFLGFLVSEHGCAPLPNRVEAIQNLPIPTTAKQLRSFIGTLQYYRRVMPNVAALLAPFHKLLQGKKKVLWYCFYRRCTRSIYCCKVSSSE